MIYKIIAAVVLLVLAALLIAAGMQADILPPIYTGIGFLVIGVDYINAAINGGNNKADSGA